MIGTGGTWKETRTARHGSHTERRSATTPAETNTAGVDERHRRPQVATQCDLPCALRVPQPSEVASWNSPIDLTFAFTSTTGWPTILLTVFETDVYDREDLGGYGVMRLPTTPGRHVRQVPITRPRGSWTDAATAFFVGGRPRYDHPQVLTTGDSRYGHATVSMGMVEIELTVLMQGFEDPALRHVSFDTDRSQAALESASLCQHCPVTRSETEPAREEEEEEDEDHGKASEQPLINRSKQQ